LGLGAIYPNFREENPAKIVSGFGGTLCLALSFMYIVGAITSLAIASPWGWHGEASLLWILSGWSIFAALSLTLGWLPYRLGLRRVQSLEV
jgi:ABC-2 type transport system permease protein